MSALRTHIGSEWRDRQWYSPRCGNQKKAGVAILMSDKIDFKPKRVTRNKEGHYISPKTSIDQEHIIIINIYTPNTETASNNRSKWRKKSIMQ